MAELIKIASIREDDKENGNKIYFLCNPKTFEVTLSNGEEVSYGDSPKNVKEAFEVLDQWQYNNTLEYLAEYDEKTNSIIKSLA